MQHCFGKCGSGGPVVAYERLLAHSNLRFGQLRQTEPAGGLNLALIRRFILEIREYRPVLIHVRGLGNEGFHAAFAARLAGVPNVLVSIHGTHRDLRHPRNRMHHWVVVNILELLTLRMATQIATVCEFAAKRPFLAPYSRKLIGNVPNGVDLPDISPTGTTSLRDSLGIAENCSLGICVSRITNEKGYPVLAQALAILDDKVRDFAVLIVGGGDENGYIKKLFSGLKNIKILFAGHQKDVSNFLAASDFFLFPSLHENLSNALIEAMAHGLPAIATAVGGNTEVVSKGGGILVPAGNAEALAAAISRFLADPVATKRMGEEARDTIRRHYSLEQMVTGWEDIYTRILENGYGHA